jgi:alginate O-acetyltransferase complex protein AlgJ
MRRASAAGLLRQIGASRQRISAAVWLTALAAALACGLAGLRRAVPEARALPAAAWRDGSANRLLEKAQRLPGSETLHSWNAGLQYRLFGDLGPKVVEGCPGWLFYRDGLGLQAGVDAEQVFAQRLRLMRYLVEQVRRSGAQLLVVTVPDKARIETEAVCGLRQSPRVATQLTRWQAALRQQGVAAVALAPALEQARPAFFRTDVHWNQQGARAAAQAVAQAAQPMLGGAGSQQYVSVTAPGGVQARMGDLIVLAGLEHAPPALRPPLDREQPVTIRAVHGGSLLDEPAPPEVLLAGSSSSRRSNFAEQLGTQLARELWNRSLDGGNFAGALQDALAERASWPPGLKLVIWELPEMALWLPLTDPEKALLAQAPVS